MNGMKKERLLLVIVMSVIIAGGIYGLFWFIIGNLVFSQAVKIWYVALVLPIEIAIWAMISRLPAGDVKEWHDIVTCVRDKQVIGECLIEPTTQSDKE